MGTETSETGFKNYKGLSIHRVLIFEGFVLLKAKKGTEAIE